MAASANHVAAEPSARYLVQTLPRATLVDSCVLIDVLADDPQWAEWSLNQLEACAAMALVEPLSRAVVLVGEWVLACDLLSWSSMLKNTW